MVETKLRNRVSRVLVAVVVAAAGVVDGEATEMWHIITSTDAATVIGGTPISDRGLLLIGRDGDHPLVRTPLDAILPRGVDVDALTMLDGGRLVFSTDVSFESAGVAADDEDLVLLDAGALSLVLDGSAAGLPPSADIDAAHVVSLAPLDVYYSVDAPVEVGGAVFADDDIVRFDGQTHTLVRSGSSLLGDEALRADLDALVVDPVNNHFIFSLDVAIESGPTRTAADAGDLVVWSYGFVLMFFDASAAGLTAPGLDLDAFSLERALFADDFETGNTSAWSTTSP
ncbi:MAG: hypothetical protein V2I67_01135 [Thermoanaerobaculales bacterium]|jgi:hypothetical protein|nr:hypothetical protein [Thermoanaerobaculales bacterium]